MYRLIQNNNVNNVREHLVKTARRENAFPLKRGIYPLNLWVLSLDANVCACSVSVRLFGYEGEAALTDVYV